MSEKEPGKSALARAEIRTSGALGLVLASRMLGLFLLLPVFAVLGADLPGSTPVLVGLAIGVYGLFQALFQIPFGLLSDRLGRKPLLFAGLLLFLAGSLVAAGAETIYGIIAGRALQGSGAVAGVIMALAADVVSEKHRTRVMAALGASVGASFVLAMILGPALAGVLGLRGLFYLCAGLALVGLLVAALLVPAPRVRISSLELPLRQRLERILAQPALLRLDLGIFVLHFVLTAIFVVVPQLLTERLDMPLERHSLLYLGVMVTGFVAMIPLILLSERRGIRPVKLVAIGLLVVSLVLLALAGQALWHFVLALFVFFTAFNLLEALLPSMVGRAAPAGTRGTSLGVYSSCQFLGVFCGGLAGGWLVQATSVSAVFWLSALLVLGWFLVVTTMEELPRLDNRVLSLDHHAGDIESWSYRLLAVEGVLEAVVVHEQGIALLKVDPATLDENALMELGRPA